MHTNFPLKISAIINHRLKNAALAQSRFYTKFSEHSLVNLTALKSKLEVANWRIIRVFFEKWNTANFSWKSGKFNSLVRNKYSRMIVDVITYFSTSESNLSKCKISMLGKHFKTNFGMKKSEFHEIVKSLINQFHGSSLTW